MILGLVPVKEWLKEKEPQVPKNPKPIRIERYCWGSPEIQAKIREYQQRDFIASLKVWCCKCDQRVTQVTCWQEVEHNFATEFWAFCHGEKELLSRFSILSPWPSDTPREIPSKAWREYELLPLEYQGCL